MKVCIVSSLILSLLAQALCSIQVKAQNAPVKIHVALFLDAGAHPRPSLIEALFAQKNIQLKTVNGEQIKNGCLKDFDVLVVPGGSARAEAYSLAPAGKDAIRSFVKGGGCYLGICAGCYLATSGKNFLDLMPVKVLDRKHWRRGKAKLPVEFTAMGNQVFGCDRHITHIVYHNGPVLSAIEENPDITPLCFYRDERVAPQGQPGIMIGSPAMVLGKYGQGLVIGISPHPELTPGLANMEPNAVLWLYEHRHRP